MRHAVILPACTLLAIVLVANQPATAQWVENGVEVCTADYHQAQVRIAPDGDNGAIIAWLDTRNGQTDIYVQRVNDEGIALWQENGILAADIPSINEFVGMQPDAEGGAYILWTKDYDLYAQRVAQDGTLAYSTDGRLLSSGDVKTAFQALSDECGEMYVSKLFIDSCEEPYPGIIYCLWDATVFHVNSSLPELLYCTPRWVDDIFIQEGWDVDFEVYPDGASGFIAYEVIEYTSEYVVKRHSAHDSNAWVSSISHLPVHYGLRCSGDGAGGATITFERYAEKFNRAGEDIITIATHGSEFIDFGESCVSSITPVHGTSGNSIYTWRDNSLIGTLGGDAVFVQQIDSLGQLQYGPDGIAVCFTTITSDEPQIVPDGHGGAIIAWENNGIVAQRIDASGTMLWGLYGRRISTSDDFRDTKIAMTDDPGAIFAWADKIIGDYYDIYAMHANPPQSRPHLEDVDDIIIGPGTELLLQLSATDPDGSGPLTYESDASDVLPWGSSIDEVAGLLTWTPSLADTGAYDVRFGVTDGEYYDCEYARITVSQSVGIADLFQLLEFHGGIRAGAVEVSWLYRDMPQDLIHTIHKRQMPEEQYDPISNIEIARDGLSFEFVDYSVEEGEAYAYLVCAESGNESEILFETDVFTVPAMPARLFQNHPNPFNPMTTIRYYIPDHCRVNLDIYDVTGKRIATLVARQEEKGYKEVTWSGLNAEGHAVGSGIYYYRLRAGKTTTSKKMVLLR